MEAAVAELLVIDIGLLVLFPCLFLDAGDILPFFLGVLDFFLNDRNDILVFVEVVVKVSGYKVIDKSPDSRAPVDFDRSVCAFHRVSVLVALLLLPHVCGTEFGLGLAFELRFLDEDAYGSDDALTAVLRLVVFLEEILECLCDSLPVCCEVGASVACILAVDKRVDVLAVAVAVGEDYFNVFSLEVNRRIFRLLRHPFIDKVQQTVVRFVGGSVQDKCKTSLEIGVVLYHCLDEVHVEGVVAEHLRVRRELHERAVLFTYARPLSGVFKFSAFVSCPGALSVPERLDIELR